MKIKIETSDTQSCKYWQSEYISPISLNDNFVFGPSREQILELLSVVTINLKKEGKQYDTVDWVFKYIYYEVVNLHKVNTNVEADCLVFVTYIFIWSGTDLKLKY